MSRPWMPLYIADYLADTMHLSTTEHGAYMLLIMHYWQNGGLPSEAPKLARIARMTPREWAGISDTIAGLFQEGWTHKRIDGELAEARSKYEKRAEAGRKGGQSKPSLSNATVNAKANDKPRLSNASSERQAMLQKNTSNAQPYAGHPRGNSQPQPQEESYPRILVGEQLDEVAEANGHAQLTGEESPQPLSISARALAGRGSRP